VATSGNISGEPVLTDNDEAAERLGTIADGFLHHDRPIARPADDSVVRRIAARIKPLRVGRGMAPLELPLPEGTPEMLAVGGHMKNTLAVSDGRRAVLTPHIGDMGTRRSLDVFRQLARELPRLYGAEPRWLVCDAHPDYATSRWARRQDLPLIEVLHHAAHASAVWGEAIAEQGVPFERPMLVFTWDGVGYGGDGTLWGGETLLGRPDAWERVGSVLPFKLPGGESAGREPWRSAAGMCWTIGREWMPELPGDELELVRHAFARNLNAPVTSAVGRIFDAASALLLGFERASYEAEGPMRVEALARRGEAQSAGGPRLGISEDPVRELLAIDWRPLVAYLVDESLPPAERAMGLHASLARAMSDLALAVRERHGDFRVGLTGGVFQNRLLTGLARISLEAHGFEVFIPHRLPVNDGAICFGQLVEAAAAIRSGAAGL
jgi:hydrogenase maturation protein HypF